MNSFTINTGDILSYYTLTGEVPSYSWAVARMVFSNPYKELDSNVIRIYINGQLVFDRHAVIRNIPNAKLNMGGNI